MPIDLWQWVGTHLVAAWRSCIHSNTHTIMLDVCLFRFSFSCSALYSQSLAQHQTQNSALMMFYYVSKKTVRLLIQNEFWTFWDLKVTGFWFKRIFILYMACPLFKNALNGFNMLFIKNKFKNSVRFLGSLKLRVGNEKIFLVFNADLCPQDHLKLVSVYSLLSDGN